LSRKPLAPAFSVVDVLVQVESGQYQDPCPGPVPGEPGGCLDAVHLGHAHVHQDHVGVQAPGLGQCLAAVAGLAGDGQVGLGFQQHPQALADEVLVIGDQDADHGSPSPSGSRARTANPPPGRGPACSSPPNIATRSRIPASPCPPAGAWLPGFLDTGKLPPRAPGKSRQDPREPVLHRAEQYPARAQAS
jgi:hypothetical protein